MVQRLRLCASSAGGTGSIPAGELKSQMLRGMVKKKKELWIFPGHVSEKGLEINMLSIWTLVAQRLKRLPSMRETWVSSLGREDPLESPWSPWVPSLVGRIPWRRKWQPTLVFLPGESHGQRSLVGYSPQGRKESDTTERLHLKLTVLVVLLCLLTPLTGCHTT